MNAENSRGNVSPAMIEIIKNSLTAITDEMGTALKKSAYSPNIKTREDYTCSLFNNRLEMLAQTAHQIGHLGAFPFIVKETMKEHDVNRLEPGDTIIFTDQMHYSFVKTNTFNGTPLANLAVRWEDGIIESLSDFGYEEFRRRLGR